MSKKLTPEWCEMEASWLDGEARKRDSDRSRMEAEAFRLAARALRAREWLTARRDCGIVTASAADVLAILDGREP